jgi:hypothetical protein
MTVSFQKQLERNETEWALIPGERSDEGDVRKKSSGRERGVGSERGNGAVSGSPINW